MTAFCRTAGPALGRLFFPPAPPLPALAWAGGSPRPTLFTLLQEVSSDTAGGRGKRTLPPSLADGPPGEKTADNGSARQKRPAAILTEEEVAALVGPDPGRPEPPGPLERALLAVLVMVLGMVVAFLWVTQPAPPASQPPQEARDIIMARTALEQGRPDQALRVLGLAATQGGAGRLAAVNRLRAEVLLARAGRTMDDQPDAALADIDSALVLAPDWAGGYTQAGRLLIRMERFTPALNAYLRALEIDPELHVAWFNLGYLYLQIQRHQQAIEAFRRAAALDPGLAADAYVNMSVSQVRLGRREEAVASLRQALEINPNHQTAREYLARLVGSEPGK